MNRAEQAAAHADASVAASRAIAAKWELNCDQWSARALMAEAKLDTAETELKLKSELLAALENKQTPEISGPSASAPAADPKTGRKRGARGRFIKS